MHPEGGGHARSWLPTAVKPSKKKKSYRKPSTTDMRSLLEFPRYKLVPPHVQLVLQQEVPPEQQVWTSSLDPEPPHVKEDPEPPHVKEDPEPPHVKEDPEPPHVKEDPEPPHVKEDPEPPHVIEDPEPPHVKEDQGEVSQEGEQLQGLEEAGLMYSFIVKSEDDEEEAQSSQLHQRPSEQMETEADGEDCGGPEPARNSDPDPDGETGVSSEPVTDDSVDWKETRDPQSEMKPIKHYTICPLCLKAYKALTQHLRRTHLVLNLDERRLLLNMASGRVNIRLAPCPVSGCRYLSSRLDKHLQDGHPELSRHRMVKETQAARRAMTVQLLGSLRATNPPVAMVSDFDIHQSDLEELQGVKVQARKLCPYQKEATEGSHPTLKQVENATSRASRVRSFLFHLSVGKSDLASWLFLDDLPGIMRYAAHLMSEGKQVTTVNFYLRNVLQFLRYLQDRPPAACRMRRGQITAVVRTVRQAAGSLSRRVVTHRREASARKRACIVSRASRRRCQEQEEEEEEEEQEQEQEQARPLIPELPTKMEAEDGVDSAAEEEEEEEEEQEQQQEQQSKKNTDRKSSRLQRAEHRGIPWRPTSFILYERLKMCCCHITLHCVVYEQHVPHILLDSLS
ncbi:hypothetical protein EYF80_036239 [Liparis tanakae]|uniref:C2H2-type domain-containing protein n=1 Tax=Liparis tanakae TaxID=230148 RepID=A0A4Z2GJS5_9TELE|nr:hypothetical protein EYF80_036239 [Liparis tanakae]